MDSDTETRLMQEAEEIIGSYHAQIGLFIHMFKEVASLGKGLKEGHYQAALCHELQERNIKYTTEEAMPIMYKGSPLGGNHTMRLDILVHAYRPIVIELKAISSTLGNEEYWQVLRYMDHKKIALGAVVNYSQSEKAEKGLEIKFVVRHSGHAFLYDYKTEEITTVDDPSYTF
jgi:GxxExxY protein